MLVIRPRQLVENRIRLSWQNRNSVPAISERLCLCSKDGLDGHCQARTWMCRLKGAKSGWCEIWPVSRELPQKPACIDHWHFVRVPRMTLPQPGDGSMAVSDFLTSERFCMASAQQLNRARPARPRDSKEAISDRAQPMVLIIDRDRGCLQSNNDEIGGLF